LTPTRCSATPGSTTSRIADVARRVPEAKPVLGHAGPADDTAAAAGLIRDIPNL
jgi:hypothetical protein